MEYLEQIRILTKRLTDRQQGEALVLLQKAFPLQPQELIYNDVRYIPATSQPYFNLEARNIVQEIIEDFRDKQLFNIFLHSEPENLPELSVPYIKGAWRPCPLEVTLRLREVYEGPSCLLCHSGPWRHNMQFLRNKHTAIVIAAGGLCHGFTDTLKAKLTSEEQIRIRGYLDAYRRECEKQG